MKNSSLRDAARPRPCRPSEFVRWCWLLFDVFVVFQDPKLLNKRSRTHTGLQARQPDWLRSHPSSSYAFQAPRPVRLAGTNAWVRRLPEQLGPCLGHCINRRAFVSCVGKVIYSSMVFGLSIEICPQIHPIDEFTSRGI